MTPQTPMTPTALIHLARTNPTIFLQMILRTMTADRPEAAAPVHRDLQAFLSHHPMALVELPRDHGKTTQVCGRILWELGHNPDLRIKLVCATDAIARERTRWLRDAIAHNPAVRLVFPHLRPASPWTARAFTVKRTAQTIGPSVAAFGVGTGSTGTRADLLVCDDVVDVRSVSSQATRERVKEYFKSNLLNLLEPSGRFWGLSTPWHPHDLNAELRKSPAFAHFRRAIGPDLKPVWPSKWTAERLMRRRAEVGTTSFARGYLLQPVSEMDVLIRPEWLRFWTTEVPRSAYEDVVLAVDPAVSEKASADASALVVLGRHGRELHVLSATARRVSAPNLVELINELDRMWQPQTILFESNAGFQGLKDLLVSHAGFGAKVQGVTQSSSKQARVSALAVAIENGAVRLRGDGEAVHVSQQILSEQLTGFPYLNEDDLPDALAMAVSHLLSRRPPRAWLM